MKVKSKLLLAVALVLIMALAATPVLGDEHPPEKTEDCVGDECNLVLEFPDDDIDWKSYGLVIFLTALLSIAVERGTEYSKMLLRVVPASWTNWISWVRLPRPFAALLAVGVAFYLQQYANINLFAPFDLAAVMDGNKVRILGQVLSGLTLAGGAAALHGTGILDKFGKAPSA